MGGNKGVTRKLYRICDFSEVCQVDILIIAQHFRTCMTDQFELVLVRRLNVFHQRREGMAARMGGILVPLVLNRIINADGL